MKIHTFYQSQIKTLVLDEFCVICLFCIMKYFIFHVQEYIGSRYNDFCRMTRRITILRFWSSLPIILMMCALHFFWGNEIV